MKTYLVTFRNKKTGRVVGEEVVSIDCGQIVRSIVLHAITSMKEKGINLPNPRTMSWSYAETTT